MFARSLLRDGANSPPHLCPEHGCRFDFLTQSKQAVMCALCVRTLSPIRQDDTAAQDDINEAAEQDNKNEGDDDGSIYVVGSSESDTEGSDDGILEVLVAKDRACSRSRKKQRRTASTNDVSETPSPPGLLSKMPPKKKKEEEL